MKIPISTVLIVSFTVFVSSKSISKDFRNDLKSFEVLSEETKPMKEEIDPAEKELLIEPLVSEKEEKNVEVKGKQLNNVSNSALDKLKEKKEEINLVEEESKAVQPNPIENNFAEVFEDNSTGKEVSFGKINETKEEIQPVEEKKEAVKPNSNEDNTAEKENKLPVEDFEEKRAEKDIDNDSSLTLGKINQTKVKKNLVEAKLDAVKLNYNDTKEEIKLPQEEFEDNIGGNDANLMPSLSLGSINENKEEIKLPEEQFKKNHIENDIVYESPLTLGKINQTKLENLVGEEIGAIEPNSVEGKVIEEIKLPEEIFESKHGKKESLSLGKINKTKEEKNLLEEKIETVKLNSFENNVAEKEKKLPEDAEKYFDLVSSSDLVEEETGVIDPIPIEDNVAKEEMKLSGEEFREKQVEKEINLKSSLTLDKVNQTKDERNLLMDEIVNIKSNSIEVSAVEEEKKLPEDKFDVKHREKEIVLAPINHTKDERNLVEGELEVIEPLSQKITQFLGLGNIKETKKEKNLTEEQLEAAEPIYIADNVAEEELKLPEEEFLDNDAGKDIPLSSPLKLSKIKPMGEEKNIVEEEMGAVEPNSIEDIVSKEEENLVEELQADTSNTVKKELKHSDEYFEKKYAENDINLLSSLKSGKIKQSKDEKNLIEEEIGDDESNYIDDFVPVEDFKLGKVLKLAEEHSKLSEEEPRLAEEDLKFAEEYLKLADEELKLTEEDPKLSEEELTEKGLVEEEIGNSESNYVNDFVAVEDFKRAEEDSKLAEEYSKLVKDPNNAADNSKFAKKNLVEEEIGDAGVSKNEMNLKDNRSGEDKDQLEESNYINDYVAVEDFKLAEDLKLTKEHSKLAKEHFKLAKEYSKLAKEHSKFAKEESKLAEEDLMLVEDEPKLAEEKPKLSEEKPKFSEEEPKLAEEDSNLAEDSHLEEEDLRLAKEFSKLTEQGVSENQMNLKDNLSGEDTDQIEEEISLFDSEEMNQLKKGAELKSRSLLGPRGYGGRGFAPEKAFYDNRAAVGGCNKQIIVKKPCGPKLRPHKVCDGDDEFDYFDSGDVYYDGEYIDSPCKIPNKSPGLKPIACKPNKIVIKQPIGYKPSKFPGIKPGTSIGLQPIGCKPNKVGIAWTPEESIGQKRLLGYKPSISWEPEGGNSYPIDGYNPNRPPFSLTLGVSDGHNGPSSSYNPSISWEPEGSESYRIDSYTPNNPYTGLAFDGYDGPSSNYIPIKSSITWVSGDIPNMPSVSWEPDNINMLEYGSYKPSVSWEPSNYIINIPNKSLVSWEPENVNTIESGSYKPNKASVSWEPDMANTLVSGSYKPNKASVSWEPSDVKTIKYGSYKPNKPSVSWEPNMANTLVSGSYKPNKPSVSWEPNEYNINKPNIISVNREPDGVKTIVQSYKPNNPSVSWETIKINKPEISENWESDGVQKLEQVSYKPIKPLVSWEPDDHSYKPNKLSVSLETNGHNTNKFNTPSISWEPDGINTVSSTSYKPIEPSVSWETDGVKTIKHSSFQPGTASLSWEPDGVKTIEYGGYKPNPSISWEPDGINTVSSTSYKPIEPPVSWGTDGVKTIKHSSFQPNKASVSWEPDGVKTLQHGSYKPNNPSVSWEPNGVKTIKHSSFQPNKLSVSWEPGGVKTIKNSSYKTNKAIVSWEPDVVNTFKSGSYKPNQPLVHWETNNHQTNIEDGYTPNQKRLSLKIKDISYKPNKPSLKKEPDSRDTKQTGHSVSHGSINKIETSSTSKSGVENGLN